LIPLVAKVEGVEIFRRAIDGLADDLDDTVPILEEVAERVYYPVMAAQFETRSFGRWPRRSPAYERRLRRRAGVFFDLPVGQVTGGLMRSLSQKGTPSNVHISVGNDSLLLGSRRPYGAAFAADRPVFDFRDKDVDAMEEVFADESKKRAERRGFKAL
jgi:hypothetical protein